MKPLYKILVIVGITILVGIIVYFIWNSLTSDSIPQTPPRGTELPLGTPLPEVGGGVTTSTSETPTLGEQKTLQAQKFSKNPAFDFWIERDTKEIYYLGLDGKIFSAKEGPDLDISNQTVEALNSIESSSKGEKILASFGNPLAPQWGIFDSIDKVWRPLPADILIATWGANERELIATTKTKDEISLATIDLTKTPFAYKILIKDFRFNDVVFSMKAPDILLFWEKPSLGYAGRVWQLNLKTLGITLLSSPQNGFSLSWSSDKTIGFRFVPPASFSLVSPNLSGLTPVFFSTFPKKCEGSATSTVYCFVPQFASLPTLNINLPDDYLQKKFFSVDDLYTIDMKNETTEKTLEGNTSALPSIDAEHPQLIDSTLYFINRYDRYIYKIDLPKTSQ
ncbi:MAG: hypothetical protein WCW78_01370 [Candidatus Paceibacterota bacterium]|jgi:hypothetical protein